MPETLTIPVRRLRKGDVLPGPAGWTAGADAEVHGGVCELMVWFTSDGGNGRRVWDDPDHTLTIEREVMTP